MAVFFNGAFTRELRREVARRIRRDTVEKIVAPHHLAHIGLNTRLPGGFSGLGSRRLMSGRGKLQALGEPKSQATGTPRNQYSSNSNQSASSKSRGPTGGTQGTSGTSRTSRTTGTGATGRTNGTTGTAPTSYPGFKGGSTSRRPR